MAKISVVISAYNEEALILECLHSVDWADEIVVVDNSSQDKTAQIAKESGAKVFTRPNNPMLNVNKNFGFTKAKNEWILCLDADERIPKELAEEIQKCISADTNVSGYWIPRKNIIFGKWIQHGLWWPDKQLRLFRKIDGKFPEQHVHEYIKVLGETQSLEIPYIHYNYSYISQFIQKMDRIYTENEVTQMLAKGYTFVWHDIIRQPFGDFVKTYFAQEAYKDGLHGLVLSILQAFYMFVVYIKIWEKNGFIEYDVSLQSLENHSRWSIGQFTFWINTAESHGASLVVAIYYKVKKRLALAITKLI